MRGNILSTKLILQTDEISNNMGKDQKLTSPNTAPSANVTNTVFPSSATTSNFPLLIIYISFPTSPLRHT